MAIVERKRKNGLVSYQVKVKDAAGNWYPTPAFDHRDLALREEARLCEMKRKGRGAFDQDARSVTLNEFWEVWSIENRADVSKGWKITQDQMYRDYVKPILGKLLMIEIGKPEIGKCLNRVKEMGRSDQTRKHVYSLLRSMMGDVVDYYEMLAMSPVKAKFHRPRVAKGKRNFLEPKAAMDLFEASKGTYLGPAIALGLLSALRISEIQALTGSALMFGQGMIRVSSAFNNKTREMQPYPKQQDWAYVPMPPMLRDYLLELQIGQDQFVAPGPKGDMLAYQTFLQALKRLCRKVGVQVITTHELRHSSTEIWMQAGASTEDIRRLLNHASLSATSAYIHRTDDRLNALGGKLFHVIDGGLSFPKSFPNGKKEADAIQEGGASNVMTS